MHDPPVFRGRTGRSFRQSQRFNVACQAFLCDRVGHGIGSPCRKDVPFGHIQKRDAIGPDVEVTADHRLFNRQHTRGSNRRGSNARVSAFHRQRERSRDRFGPPKTERLQPSRDSTQHACQRFVPKTHPHSALCFPIHERYVVRAGVRFYEGRRRGHLR